MKVLIVQDSEKWAIGKLSRVIVDFNKHIKIETLTIPPKELRAKTEENTRKFEDKVNEFNPDIIHFQYWDIANTLSKSKVCEGRKLILTHHNQKNLLSHDWSNFDLLVVHTQKARKKLLENGYFNVIIIQHGIDIEYFRFKEKLDMDNRLLGYVGRIVPWKGLLGILSVADKIQSEVLMMGYIDKPDYWNKCLEYEERMDIRFRTEYQVPVFHEMACYVGNSDDDIEEGTLGLLEAMACGIPVITTPSGEAADIIEDGVNGILVEFNNTEDLLKKVQMFFTMSEKSRNEMREKAWGTVKNMSQEVMARNYEKAYYSVLYDTNLVSVVIPSYKRHETISSVLDSYSGQSYKPIEIVLVVDDKENEEYKAVVEEWKKENDIPIKLFFTNNEGYGLAQARNIGIFESSGNYIVFNDDRFAPEWQSVEAFVSELKKEKQKIAVWGDKGAGKRDFMENFFAIRRKHIVDAGMFNERINEYGGQSQEIRERLRNQGFILHFEPAAKSGVLIGTHSRSKKRYEIFRTKLKLWKVKN